MKLKLVVLFLALVPAQIMLAEFSDCECGEHATGITAYTVEGEDCCTSPVAAESVGWFHEYENQGGVWKRVNTTELVATEAQQTCCNPS